MVKEPYDVAGYFSSLLEFAAKLVPDEEHSNTPIFAFATAGLRSLAESQNERIFDDDDLDNDHMLDIDDDDFNKGKIAKTLSATRQLFHNSTFYFHDSNVKVRCLFFFLSLLFSPHSPSLSFSFLLPFVLLPPSPVFLPCFVSSSPLLSLLPSHCFLLSLPPRFFLCHSSFLYLFFSSPLHPSLQISPSLLCLSIHPFSAPHPSLAIHLLPPRFYISKYPPFLFIPVSLPSFPFNN